MIFGRITANCSLSSHQLCNVTCAFTNEEANTRSRRSNYFTELECYKVSYNNLCLLNLSLAMCSIFTKWNGMCNGLVNSITFLQHK